ncbi:MAG TPA: PAS domain S-box protein [Opitutaceae bacterium]|nr:PAS domain S-box protein [Opitutaceae bacterium]
MKKELRILMLEDVAADVVLIDHELRRAGLSFEMKRVETRDQFTSELAERPPDVILSDHGLPEFDGFAALAIAHERCPDIPFIFVTGSMGEELAIDSLRSGATDYVLKTRISNLAPAIERALHVADERRKRRQAERELRASEERFRLLVSGVKDYAIFMLDADGKISSWNAGAELVLGHAARDIVGQHFSMFYRPAERDAGKPQADLAAAAERGGVQDEGWRLRKGGTPFWAHVDIRALRDDDGHLRGFTQVTRDATERRHAEESLRKSEERYRRLVELCPDALMVLTELQIVFVNSAAQQLLGAHEPHQLIGRGFLDFVAAEERENVAQRLREIAGHTPNPPWQKEATGPRAFIEESLVRLDGSVVSVEMGATRLTFEDEPAMQLILHDITDQKNAAAAWRESEARKTAILETSLDAIVSIDHRGIVREWNVAAERIFGYRREEALGHKLESLIVPAEPTEKYLPGLADYLAAGVANLIGRPVEAIARRKSGEQFPLDLALTQIPLSDPPFFTAFIREITDRKQGEEALRRSEARKAAVLESALDAIISVDQEGKVIEWNPAAEKTFGYSRELAIGRDLRELIEPRSTAELERRGLARFLQTGRGRLFSQRLEAVALRANGAEFPVELTITRIPGDGPLIFTMFIRDIAERKRTEEALRKSEERFRLLVESIEDYAIYMLDTHGRITTWNVGAERIDGYRPQEIIGRRFHRFYTAEDCERKKPDQALAVATAEGRFQDECWHVRKDGSQYWATFVITALRDESGKLYGFSKIARDVTKRKQTEDEIKRLNSELEHRVQTRTTELQTAYQEMEAFSYSISHDLRAPLIHIAGFVEMLRSEIGHQLDEKSRRHLQTICDSTEHMGRMIADLLSFSRIGRAEMHRIRIGLTEIVRDVQRELQAQLQGRRVTWIIGELPEVWGDPILLRQVVLYLLANAVKFTRPREEARIEVGAEEAPGEHVLFVRDNGVGFDMKYAGKLFGVFQRLHPASEFEGTGIGLANVRRIIQRHGGRTWVESAPNQGATLYFSLPTAAPAKP